MSVDDLKLQTTSCVNDMQNIRWEDRGKKTEESKESNRRHFGGWNMKAITKYSHVRFFWNRSERKRRKTVSLAV